MFSLLRSGLYFTNAVCLHEVEKMKQCSVFIYVFAFISTKGKILHQPAPSIGRKYK